MTASILQFPPESNPSPRETAASVPFDPTARGYHVSYRLHETNHCPGCGRTHWYVGRLSAECAFCGTAVELEGAKR
jgi:hypothetical protein